MAIINLTSVVFIVWVVFCLLDCLFWFGLGLVCLLWFIGLVNVCGDDLDFLVLFTVLVIWLFGACWAANCWFVG